MKNIAIPLLLAGSAKAEAKKKAAMLLDYAEPSPILIASSWTGDVCVDAAGDVAEALSELQAAQDDLEELGLGVEALEEAEDDAVLARILAVGDVIELDEAMESDVEANNEAIADLIGLKQAWQEANVDASIGEALVATRLSAQSAAQGDYDEAVIDYAGFAPTEEEEDDGAVAVAGLLSVTTGLFGELDAAEETRDGLASVAGSLLNYHAAYNDYASKNCSASSDSGSLAGGDLVVQCAGTYQNAEATDYSAYTQSLDSLESAVDSNLVDADSKNLTKAAKYLLKTEYNQIQKYLGYAVVSALADQANTGSEADYDSTTLYTDYPGTSSDVLTQAEIIAIMTAQNADLTLTSHTTTGTAVSKAKTWVDKLRLVYGDATNAANDGDGSTVSSEEYMIIQTSDGSSTAAGAGGWVTDATSKASTLATYITTYNSNIPASATTEVGSDGYNSAYTELLTGGNSGACTSSSDSGLAGLTTFNEGITLTLGWASASTNADFGESDDTGTAEANSICAKACSAKLDWGHDSSTNLPDSSTQTNTACTGFEVDVSTAGAGATSVECTLFFNALPTADSGISSDSTLIECWERNFSNEAKAYVDVVVGVATDSGDWDDFNTAATNWDTAFQALIDARAELDIAVFYHTQLNGVYDDSNTTATNAYGNFVGYKQQYDVTVTSVTTGALIQYTDASTDYTNALSTYTSSETTYSNRAVAIASANSDYVLAQAQWEENNALISKLTVLHEIANTASAAALLAEEAADDALEEATDDWQDAVDAYEGVAATESVSGSTGLVELQTDAQEAYDDAYEAIYGESGTGTALGEYEASGDGELGELFGLRLAAGDAYEDLVDAMEDLMDLDGEIMGAQGDVEEAMAVHLAAIVACKVENYDAYTETLQLAVQQREDDLDDILALVTEAEEDEPAAGAAGSRCEKALSNGTFRPQRGEGTCNEGLCCGAARVPMGEVTMTIETCQAITETSYSYVPARAPMATEPPAAEVVDFVCIDGAKKLAAAASALATAVYMLA